MAAYRLTDGQASRVEAEATIGAYRCILPSIGGWARVIGQTPFSLTIVIRWRTVFRFVECIQKR
jgi:proline racemase